MWLHIVRIVHTVLSSLMSILIFTFGSTEEFIQPNAGCMNLSEQGFSQGIKLISNLKKKKKKSPACSLD